MAGEHLTDGGSFIHKTVRTCPVVNVQLGGVDVGCLIGTGTEVSTITEQFFNEHLMVRLGFLVVRDPMNTLVEERKKRVPGVLVSNILRNIRETLVHKYGGKHCPNLLMLRRLCFCMPWRCISQQP